MKEVVGVIMGMEPTQEPDSAKVSQAGLAFAATTEVVPGRFEVTAAIKEMQKLGMKPFMLVKANRADCFAGYELHFIERVSVEHEKVLRTFALMVVDDYIAEIAEAVARDTGLPADCEMAKRARARANERIDACTQLSSSGQLTKYVKEF
jgi:hypothetical protein